MRGANNTYTSRRTAPRSHPSNAITATTAEEVLAAQAERRPSQNFTALTFVRADEDERVARFASRPATSVSPPQLNADALAHTSHAMMGEALAAGDPFLPTPPEEALVSPGQSDGPLVTETWTRSVLHPGDEQYLYEAVLAANTADRIGAFSSAGGTSAGTAYTTPGRRVLYRWQNAAQTRNSHAHTRDGAYTGLWRYGVTPQGPSESQLYAQLGKFGRLGSSRSATTSSAAAVSQSREGSAVPSESTFGRATSGAFTTAAGAGRAGTGGGGGIPSRLSSASSADRHVPRLFSRPSYQMNRNIDNNNSKTASVTTTTTAIDTAAEADAREGVSSTWGATSGAFSSNTDAERGTELIRRTRDELLETLRVSQERQGIAVTTEVYPRGEESPARRFSASGQLLKADPTRWTTRTGGADGHPRRRPNLETERDAQSKAEALARAYEPVGSASTAHVTATASSAASGSVVDAFVAGVLVNDPFFPLTSEENYERMLLKNDEYEARLRFRAAWDAHTDPPPVSPFRSRHDDSHSLSSATATAASTSTLVAPFGYRRASTRAEGQASTERDTKPDPSLSSRTTRTAVPIKLARKSAGRKSGSSSRARAEPQPQPKLSSKGMRPRTTSTAPKETTTTTTTASRDTAVGVQPARGVVPTSRPLTPARGAGKPTPRPSGTAARGGVGSGQAPHEGTAIIANAKKTKTVPRPRTEPPADATSAARPAESADTTHGGYASVSEEIAALLQRRSPSPTPVMPSLGTAGLPHAVVSTSAIAVEPEKAAEGSKATPPATPTPLVRTPRRPSLDSTTATPGAIGSLEEPSRVGDTPGDRTGLSARRTSGASRGSSPPAMSSRENSPVGAAAAAATASARIVADAVMPTATAATNSPGRRTLLHTSNMGYVSPVVTTPNGTPLAVSSGATFVPVSPSTSASSTISATPASAFTAAVAAPITGTTSTAAISGCVGVGVGVGVSTAPRRSSSRTSIPKWSDSPRLPGGDMRTFLLPEQRVPLERRAAEHEVALFDAAEADVLDFSLGPWGAPVIHDAHHQDIAGGQAEEEGKKESAASTGSSENTTVEVTSGTHMAQPQLPSSATSNAYTEELRFFIKYYLRKARDGERPDGEEAAAPRIASRGALVSAVRQATQVAGDEEMETEQGEEMDPLDDGSLHERNVQRVLDVFGLVWQSPTLFRADTEVKATPRPAVVEAVEALFVRPHATSEE